MRTDAAIARLYMPNSAGFQYPAEGDRSWIQLSSFYSSCLADLRRKLASRRTGWEVVELWAPINAEPVHVALNRKSLYLRGIKAAQASDWWGIPDKQGPPSELPDGGMKPAKGRGDYSFFGLTTSYNITPVKFLAALRNFNGDLRQWDNANNAVLLFFLVAEALRFDSVELECLRWLATAPFTPPLTPE
jgi:hypothetical protein